MKKPAIRGVMPAGQMSRTSSRTTQSFRVESYMEPIENAPPEKYSSSRSTIILTLIVIGAQALISLFAYPFLPEQIPIHWDAAGQVNGYGPKLVYMILWPALSLVMFFVMRGLVLLGPRLINVNSRANLVWVERMLLMVILFTLGLQLVAIAGALKAPVNTASLVLIFVSLLFIFIGNYMGKLRRNFWMGIRTPWTLVSDVVWERTHRVGGWLFVAAGVLSLFMSFISGLRVWGPLTVILGMVIWLALYSYLVYRRVERGKSEPASPPFGEEG